MKELKCPKCGSVFTVDEADYAFILQQVKTTAFDAELERRLREVSKEEKTRLELALARQKSELGAALEAKDCAGTEGCSQCSSQAQPPEPRL